MKAPANVANRNSGSSKVIPSMCSLKGKASSACMGSPLNGEAATSPEMTLRPNWQNRNRLQGEDLAGGLECVRARHRPGVAEAYIVGAVDQFARTKRRIELREGADLGGGGTLREMDRAQLLRMIEAGGAEQFGQRMQRGVVIIIDPIDLVRHHQRASAGRILGGDAGGAAVGMAGERLDAGERAHETARRV